MLLQQNGNYNMQTELSNIYSTQKFADDSI